MNTALEPVRPRMAMGTLEDPKELGQVLAASGYFSDTRDAAQAVVKVLAGAELGFGPIASMTGVYIVKGRVTLSANLIAASIKRHPLYDYRVRTHTNDVCDVVYLDRRAKCVACNGSGVVNAKVCSECVGSGLFALGSSEFTMADARQANLAGSDNWKKYPRNMLFARALSNGAKFYTPDVFAGAPIYTPDELGAEIDPETGEVIDVPALDFRGNTGTPAPEPAPTPASSGDAEPAAPSSPEPGGSEPDPEPVATATVDEDPDAILSDDEVAKLRELLDSLGAPEPFWRMALMGFGVNELSDLTHAQARDVMDRANARFGK